MRGSDGPYQGDPFDYLAAYKFQEDMWYIIPAELVVGQGSIALYTKLGRAKYGPYKEAWELLQRENLHSCRTERGKNGARATEAETVEIQACAEENAEDLLWMGWLWRVVSEGARCVSADRELRVESHKPTMMYLEPCLFSEEHFEIRLQIGTSHVLVGFVVMSGTADSSLRSE